MICMSLLVLFRPAVVSPPSGTAVRRVSETPSALIGLLAAGFYGGFIQAGVGFLLLASIAGTLRYDIVRRMRSNWFVRSFLRLSLSRSLLAGPGRLDGWFHPINRIRCWRFLGVKFAVYTDPRVLRWFLFAADTARRGAAMVS